ncbi:MULTISPECIES: hypothetical protein [Pseudoalteromonas]|uniref:hypothetical protein n=1 Tax=Pseudoalteromonas TaxID=53246 RepID=UPI000C33E3BC|nr:MULTISPECIES: hypothetical protein [Pseudoalteromonas]PKG65445.1 hypothetical protein CXF75_07580 [Pseudoalteromonas arctica]PKG69561.1 hypothetical protein CXF64_15325 [Pseudoalteromonas sp. GutCa3]
MIYLINDQKKFNARYRSDLIGYLESKSYIVRSEGFFDGPVSFIFLLIKVIFCSRMIISSNLKSNTLLMCLFWKKAGIIVNGLGRYKRSQSFRMFWLFLMKINKKKKITFQNYLDFRYFRRHSKFKNIYWVPGSGGSPKFIGSCKEKIIIISRDEKLTKIANSVNDFLSLHNDFELVVVGCSDTCTKDSILERFKPKVTGYVEQSNIFSCGGAFLQPEGYGEGVPHTLVDAISSGLDIYITKQQFLEFGFNKLGFSFTQCQSNWVKIGTTPNSVYSLSVDKITSSYCDIFLPH